MGEAIPLDLQTASMVEVGLDEMLWVVTLTTPFTSVVILDAILEHVVIEPCGELQSWRRCCPSIAPRSDVRSPFSRHVSR